MNVLKWVCSISLQSTTSLDSSLLFYAFITVPPKILPSSDCANNTGHINCSCETVGNPSPTLHWYVDGLPVNHSDKFTISSQSVNGRSLRSIIIVDQPHRKDLIIVVCSSTNSLGFANQTFCVLGAEHQISQGLYLAVGYEMTQTK